MSRIYSHSFGVPGEWPHGPVAGRVDKNSPQPERGEDQAMDVALRAVPLPEGLMTRLGLLVYTMPEETISSVDWLGC